MNGTEIAHTRLDHMPNISLCVCVSLRMLKVALFQNIELAAPYGSCASPHLPNYPDSNYTSARCLSQCKAKHLAKVCECRDVHMKGKGALMVLLSYNNNL